MDSTSIAVPAKTEFISVVRAVVVSLAAQASLSIDEVEDLRLASSEACVFLLRIAPAGRTIRATIDHAHGIIKIIASIDDVSARSGGADTESVISWQILGAFAEGARMEWTPTGPALHLHRVGAS